MIEGASPSRGHRYWPSKARAFERDVDQSCEAIDDCAAAPVVVFLCDLGPATRASLEFSEGRLRKCCRAVESMSSVFACACHGSAERACAIEGVTNVMDVGLVESSFPTQRPGGPSRYFAGVHRYRTGSVTCEQLEWFYRRG